MANETIATYQDKGETYEIDHLGVGLDSQWGEFAIYRDEVMVGEFAIPESALKPEFRPPALPVTTEHLIDLAKAAVSESQA
jgi:hypothetical protein